MLFSKPRRWAHHSLGLHGSQLSRPLWILASCIGTLCPVSLFRGGSLQLSALTKKGLRPSSSLGNALSRASALCPDEEGIKTGDPTASQRRPPTSALCPDEEGIKTVPEIETSGRLDLQLSALTKKGLRPKRMYRTSPSSRLQLSALTKKGLRPRRTRRAPPWRLQLSALTKKGLRRCGIRPFAASSRFSSLP